MRSLHRASLAVYRRMPRRVRRWIVRALAPSFTVGAMCIIERADGALLLVRHSYRRRWGVPGGLLKRREDAAEAVRREVMEEVGLAVDLLGEPAVVVDAVPQRVDLVFRGRPAPGADPEAVTPRSVEIVELGWFPPDALPPLQFETTDALMTLARAAAAGPPVPPVPPWKSDPGG